jgi:hypothetical protein
MSNARQFTFRWHYDEFYDLLGIFTIHEILSMYLVFLIHCRYSWNH